MWMFVLYVLVAVVARWVPHPVNFTPLLALSLCAPVFWERKLYVYLSPLLALFISDLLLGFYDVPIMMTVYGSVVLLTFLGTFFKKWEKRWTWFLSPFLGSVLFFLLTNGAVWAWSGMYPKGLNGLWQAYLAGLPFFKNTLLSTYLFSFAFLKLLDYSVEVRRSSEESRQGLKKA